MSYILDALRKSDQLRRRSTAPTLPLGQVSVAAPKQPALIFYGLLAFVLLGAGIAIGWLRPWQATPEMRPPATATVTPHEPDRSPAPRPELAAKPERQAGEPVSVPAAPALPLPAPAAYPVPAPAQAPGSAGAGVERQGPSAPPKPVAELPQRAAVPPPAPVASSANATAPAAPASAVMTVAQLPAAIQQELPPLSTSVHAYSGRPAERLVGINNRLLHEGDEVAPGLKLEQITPEGMILSYKGYTFRRGVH